MIEEIHKFTSALDLQLREGDLEMISVVLPHEHIFQSLSHNVSEQNADIESLTLDTISKIRENPQRCFRNLNLNSVEEQHFEMQCLQEHPLVNGKKLLIIESTSAQNGQDSGKLKEISRLIGADIAKGFTFGQDVRKIDLKDEKIKILFSAQNILDQIALEFEMGSSSQKPSFLGELDLSQMDLTSNIIHENCLTAYLHLSRVKRVPIFFDLANSPLTTKTGLEILRNRVSKADREKIVVFNPSASWSEGLAKETDEGAVIVQRSLSNFSEISQIIEDGFILGFDVLRYECTGLKHLVSILLKKNPSYINSLLLSSGVKYRSDLTKYGGQGYFAMLDFINNLNINDSDKRILLRENALRILDWDSFKVVQKIVAQWICPQCQKQYPETIEKYQKFGREFCSIQCLKKAVK